MSVMGPTPKVQIAPTEAFPHITCMSGRRLTVFVADERVRGLLGDGLEIVESIQKADLVILDAGSVRGPSEHRAQMTSREREVVQLLAEGKPMKEVANLLKLSTRTVAFHKYGVMRKLGLNSSAELVRLAVAEGLVA